MKAELIKQDANSTRLVCYTGAGMPLGCDEPGVALQVP